MQFRISHIYAWRILAATLFFFVASGFSFAKTDSAFIQTELKNRETLWPGQRQTLYVKLFTITSFSGSTRFGLPKPPGMLIMENKDRPLLGTEKIDGVSYVFKQHEIDLFPQYAGNLTLPPFSVEFGFRGKDGKVDQRSFTTDKHQLNVKKIPGADPDKPIITTTDLKIDDHWNPLPAKAKVGDAFTRTITITAKDLPGMVLPPFTVQKIKGLGVYTKQARISDQMQRGEFSGKRIETINYVCEQQGNFSIAQTHIQWWSPENNSLQDILLKAVELKVEANPLLQQEIPATDTSEVTEFSWKWILTLVFILLLTGGFFIWWKHRTKLQNQDTKESEGELFDAFQKTAVSHDPAATMQALLHWLDHSNLTGNSGNLAHFIKRADDPDLNTQMTVLETILYAKGQKQQWSGDKLCNAVQRARKKLKNNKSPALLHDLPALNP